MENLSLKEFAAALSGKDAVPGGGGASACTGSYGCALGMMACALTHGKKKYACYEEDLYRIEKELGSCRDALLSCIQQDADGFLPLSKAYRLPKETPEQKEKKELVLESALYQASQAPLKIIKESFRAMILMDELSGKCSKLIVSDVITGAALLEAAARGGFISLKANTGLMKNRETAKDLEQQADELLSQTLQLHKRISRLLQSEKEECLCKS